jgi:Mn2+/Fe2+ NRAMP family transporter
VLILAAMIFAPLGMKLEHYSQLPTLLTPVFGYWGFWLLVASLGIACMGAAMEITLEIAYYTAQGFGWNWSKNQPPVAEARFSVFYSATLVVAALLALTGIDPLTITIFSMALTAATLPVSIVPFLFLMNDYSYVRGYRNSWFSNLVVILIIGLAFVLAVVAIPLQIFGGS